MRAAIVLAAGSSRRFRGGNKLLARFRGRPLIDHAIAAARAAPVGRIIVVTGHDRKRVAARAAGPRVTMIFSPRHRGGLSESLRSGLRALWPIERQLYVFLGDVPIIADGLPAKLARSLRPRDLAVRARGRAGPGHPVLLRRPLSEDVRRLGGDNGIGALIAKRTRWIATNQRHSADIDTRRDLVRRR